MLFRYGGSNKSKWRAVAAQTARCHS